RAAPSPGAVCGGSHCPYTCSRKTMPMYASNLCFTGCFIAFSPSWGSLRTTASTSIPIRSKGLLGGGWLERNAEPRVGGAARGTTWLLHYSSRELIRAALDGGTCRITTA